MKQNLTLMLSAVMLVVASCSKSKDEPKDEAVSCQLTESSSPNGKTTYTYNGDGKLTASKIDAYQETYEYTSTSIIWKFIEPSGTIYTTTYLLDAQGRVKSSSDNSSNSTFTYNSERYLTEVNTVGSSAGKVTYTWTNGNLTKVERITTYGTNTINIEYGTESRPTGFNGDISSHLETAYWHDGDTQILTSSAFGKQPKNLVAKVSNTTYTYTKDNNANITKMVEKAQGGSETVYEYKYNCK